jgi:chemotaxis protein CheZ
MGLARRKSFRIEMCGVANAAPADGEDIGAARHREIMRAIADLHTSAPLPDPASLELLNRQRAELEEAGKIKAELNSIYKAIEETKREIATLHHTGFDEVHMSAVSNELDAVVQHTERATETILCAAEVIDSDAANLSASLKGSENEMAADIQDQVVKIFEACNFQDVTGQRITKVVNTLKFIEARVVHMMEIWGGIESFNGVAPITMVKPTGDKALLNGPSMDGDPMRASQDDIDALFD